MSKQGRITGLFYYPVKSCRGIAATSVEIAERGIMNDRNWVVADAEGQKISQREISKMALIETSVDEKGVLTLKAPDQTALKVAPGNGCKATVDVWGSKCAGIDEGDEAANWLGSFLETKCRLVRVAEDNDRQCAVNRPDGSPIALTFVDGAPLLVISQESLNDLNNRLSEPVAITRFRPNLVIEGLGAFSEDDCDELKIGDMTLFKIQACERCVITTIDPESGRKGVEPLKTLSSYRRIDKKVIFGTYYMHSSSGNLTVGDELSAD